MTYNTGNAVGSKDPRDLSDNAENFDRFTNGTEESYPDRLGVARKSVTGMHAEFNAAQAQHENEFTAAQAAKSSRFDDFLLNSGYEDIGAYAADLVLYERNQVLLYSGEYYRSAASASLPVIMTGVWAADSASLVAVGDAVLRQDMANANDISSGAKLVGWRSATVLDGLDLAASRTKSGYYGGQLAQLKRDLEHPLAQATFIKCIGDSITWGMTVSGGSATEPRTGQLTDPRNNLTSPSWFNLLHQWLGRQYFRAAAPTSTDIGEVTYSRQVNLWPASPLFVRSDFGASEGVMANTGATLKFYIDYVTDGKGITFDMYGAAFYLVYAQLGNGADYELFVDGVSQGVFGTAGTVQFGAVRGHNFTSGQHKIQIIKRGDATSTLRIEAIRVVKTLTIKNDGIIGRTTANWLPGAGLLDDSVQTRDKYVFAMLGTNDRGQTNQPTSPTRITENLTQIIDWMASQRPEARPILLCANETNQDAVAPYNYDMGWVRAGVAAAAQSRSVDLIDFYEVTRDALTNGVDYLAPSDQLHPGNLGHYLMHRVIVEAIRNADAGTFGVGTNAVTRPVLDLNTVTLAGEYYAGSATANNPAGETALVIVSPQGDGRIIQRIYPYSGARSWRRTRLSSGAWIAREDAIRSETLQLAGGAMTGVFKAAGYTLTTLPAAAGNDRGLIWVSDLTDGPFFCYCDGYAWRRLDTKAIAA